MVAAIACAALAGALLYLVVIRPFFRRRAALGWIGATAAVAFAVEAALAAAFPRQGYVFPDPFSWDRFRPLAVGNGSTVPVRTFWVLGAGLVVAVAVDRFLSRSRQGRALMATASDPGAAALIGLPVDRLVATGFALAGALAAIAGVIVAPGTTIEPQTGLVFGLKGLAAALLGGLVSPRRAFGAGLVFGVLEGAIASWHVPGLPSIGLGPAWRDIGPLLVAVGVLAVRPPTIAREAGE